jgi:hypothetical protein
MPQSFSVDMPVYWVAGANPQHSYHIFVPYYCFKLCATCLDVPDLRATLVRTVRVLRYLDNPVPDSYNYISAAEKWRNHRQSLIRYGIYCAEKYVERGGSDKVLEYLNPLVRRREWHKPNFVYDPNELKHQREHLMFRGDKRAIVKAIHSLQPNGIRFFKSQLSGPSGPLCRSLNDCDESILYCFGEYLKRRDIPIPENFYSQYNWNVPAHRGNFE